MAETNSGSGSYSQRLFGRGLYGMHHRGRFAWLSRKLTALGDGPQSFLELGCYDGRAIDCIPQTIERYVGIDAGWESGAVGGRPVGIDAAIAKYGSDPRFTFVRSVDPEDLLRLDGTFDVGISLETIEHIRPALVPAYVAALAEKVTGTVLVSVPNEKGLPLLAKAVGAKVLRVQRSLGYTPMEFVNALLGRMEGVARDDHKGFDWEALVEELRRRFVTVTVEGVGVGAMSPHLHLTVGIVAAGRR